MCGNTFVDIPSLLTHYQKHTLEHSCLRRPITKQPLCRVIARYKFDGERATDLSFERGEILDIIDKPEELWWSAKNALNNTGLIPVTYVKTVANLTVVFMCVSNNYRNRRIIFWQKHCDLQFLIISYGKLVVILYFSTF